MKRDLGTAMVEEMMRQRASVSIRKAWIGWWVDGYWCPTRKIRDHWIAKRTR